MPSQSTTQKKEEELEKKLGEIKTKGRENKYTEVAERFGFPFSNLKGLPTNIEALGVLDEETVKKANIAILYKDGPKLTLAIVDPENIQTKTTLESLRKNGFALDIFITTPEALNLAWEKYKTIAQKVFKIGAIEIDENELIQLEEQLKDIGDIKNKLQNISATKLLEILIAGALKTKASDIHFETENINTRIRYRLDGVLHDVATLEKVSYVKVLNRVKILSKMKLNIHDSPQDGRFTIKQKDIDPVRGKTPSSAGSSADRAFEAGRTSNGIEIEVRVSVIPSEFGETIVMRLLDPRAIKGSLEDLGIRKDLLEIVRQELKRKTGAIMTSGPTGSGKTTTLYAFVNALNDPGTKIITIEDPIEYHIEHISQTQVDPKKKYTFSNGLRAIVRQDPDIILVGEIRDRETADIALNAALTGHLVLSTIHTNDAAGIIPRLIDLGVRPQIIAPAINLSIAQRLLRKLCPDCKKQVSVTVEELGKIKKILEPIQKLISFPKLTSSLKLYKANKCEKCNFSGYLGRTGVFELFKVSKSIEKLILTSPSISDIEETALTEGMTTMIQDAYLKLLDGITSLEEIEKTL